MLAALADAAGFEVRRETVVAPVDGSVDAEWLNDAARWLGIETSSVTAAYSEAPDVIRACAPGLVRLDDRSFLAIVRVRGRKLDLIGPDGERVWIPTATLVNALRGQMIASVAA